METGTWPRDRYTGPGGGEYTGPGGGLYTGPGGGAYTGSGGGLYAGPGGGMYTGPGGGLYTGLGGVRLPRRRVLRTSAYSLRRFCWLLRLGAPSPLPYICHSPSDYRGARNS